MNSLEHQHNNLSAVKIKEKSTALSILSDNQDQAIILHISFNKQHQQEELQEFCLLAKSAKVHICQIIQAPLNQAQAKYLVGTGKAEEVAQAVKQQQANVLLVNHQLTPSQIRNLEKCCQCRVLDRTGVILDIFAQRARSHEGKLQVELAQLNYLATNLIRRKTSLDQQKGAIGLRGPGETQLETDRRLIKVRINQLKHKLAKVANQRQQNRHSRQKSNIATISLVGYTNAGKSTLFNQLTQADVYAADQLFATLDPTLRQLSLDHIGHIVLADTVGFIRHLPHDLVMAFKATLQEVNQANLLLHVIDISDNRQQQNILAVEQVLKEINAEAIPTLLVYNKIDQIENMRAKIDYDQQNNPIAVYLSANSGEGIDLLLQAIKQRLNKEMLELSLKLTPTQGNVRHRLYQLNAITQETFDQQGNLLLTVTIDKVQWLKLIKQFPYLATAISN
ncbi:GTP-binding protein HflX [Volucribacter psittacicida]|uniref:GTPase HflX n=1 Tax=Volucribacter psittacicida TaxID=203482 RepID=A0A4R1GC94_9PAST|nr:ribosome rescue GTPase HflX [Volucribacter psittacicida]TCK01942.1 GTP-binding protein HflX [Volucribacter psittacicida]